MATNPHLILCNGAPETASRPKAWSAVAPQSLATFGRQANVTLKIKDLTDQMVEKLPHRVHDLMELATLIYAADQECRRLRGTGKTIDWGETWHRTFRFEVMVREPDFWNQSPIQEALVDTLGFLSGDNFEFVFRKMTNPPSFPEYLEFNKTSVQPDPVERVILFSGGLDSLAGAVEEVLVNKRRIAMVSHKPVNHLAVKQRNLVASIAKLANDPKLRPEHYAVKASKMGDTEEDYTQRSRSFLYASMAASVAQFFGLNAIYFYENGIVGVNLPLCQQELSSRATRTTHPQTLHGFARIFSLVLGRAFGVHNDFLWKTKQDVLETLKQSGHMELARDSLSCTHTRKFTLPSPHCGLCSQCVSRRIAAFGAGYGDNDPATGYRADVLLSERKKDGDRILAERFVGVARLIEDMTSVAEFHQAFAGELGRIYPYLGLPAKTAAEKLFDLHHRHAEQVGQVMLGQMVIPANADARRRGTLSDTCMLNYAFSVGRPTAKTPKEPAAADELPVKPSDKEVPQEPADFTFAPGQVFYKGLDLGLPTGATVEVATKLVEHLGKTVLFAGLDANSEQYQAGEQLRAAVSRFNKALKKAQAPYKVNVKVRTGYVLQPAPKSRHK